MKCFQFR